MSTFFDWPSSLTRFVRFDAARAEEVNAAFDEVSAGFDDVEIKTNAALRLPDGEASVALPASSVRKGKVIGFNATTGEVEAVITYDQISLAQTYANNSQASAVASAASEANSLTYSNNSLSSANDSAASAADSAASAALSSSAALNNLTARSYFLFTM